MLTVQRQFRSQFHKRIRFEIGMINSSEQALWVKSPGRPSTSEVDVERIRECFRRSSQKSTARASWGNPGDFFLWGI